MCSMRYMKRACSVWVKNLHSASCRTGHQPANLITMHCVYACANSSHIKALRHIVFLIFCLRLAKDSRVTQCVYGDFLMNSDGFKLIFGSDTESEEDYTFNWFLRARFDNGRHKFLNQETFQD